MTLSWAGGRRLASVSKEGLSASYVYNSDGIRTQKTVNGVTTNYYLDGNSILRQVTGNNVLEFFYDTNGVLGFYYNNTPYYYLKNLQGDIVGILDANGTQVVSYTYDAWGAPLSVTGTAADTIGQLNPFRYRSYYYDNETGFYYLISRYYDPETCRFLNADGLLSTGQGILGYNMYAYCMNNPANRIDSNGDWSILLGILAVVVGALVIVPAVHDNWFSDVYDSVSTISSQIEYGVEFNNSIDSHAENVVNKASKHGNQYEAGTVPNGLQHKYPTLSEYNAHVELIAKDPITEEYVVSVSKGRMWSELSTQEQEQIHNCMVAWDLSAYREMIRYYEAQMAKQGVEDIYF